MSESKGGPPEAPPEGPSRLNGKEPLSQAPIAAVADGVTMASLEYPLILNGLASRCVTEPGRSRALMLEPGCDRSRLEDIYRGIGEVGELHDLGLAVDLSGIESLQKEFKNLGVEGLYLLADDILKVLRTLESLASLSGIFDQIPDNPGGAGLGTGGEPQFKKRYPVLTSIISALSDHSELLKGIRAAIDDKGQVKDTASPALSSVRRGIKKAREKGRTILQRFPDDDPPEEGEFLTIRDDRYVLSIRAGRHVKFPGVIHGRSGSGGTYYIEPFELVEINNSILDLLRDEAREVVAVLKSVTGLICEEADSILADIGRGGEVDLLFARYRFGCDLNGTIPSLSLSGVPVLKGARHPILLLKSLKERGVGGGGASGTEVPGAEPIGAEIIPQDIIFEEGTKVLVISGANTGGKTVALKSLGLITLMAATGLPVPLEEGSTVRLFKRVSSDIGDSQNLEESLSTFSGHLTRLKDILEYHGGDGLAEPAGGGSPGSPETNSSVLDSLVLLDEIGVGTDPAEGSVLSLAVLEGLKRRGALTAVTTHLNLIKARGLSDKTFRNGKVEFDDSTGRPLYSISYGLPGSSMALTAASNIGLPGDIMERARGYLHEKEGSFISSVESLEEARNRYTESRALLEEEASKRREVYEKFATKRNAHLERARRKIDEIVDGARAEARRSCKELLKRASLLVERGGRSKVGSEVATLRGESGKELEALKGLLPRKEEKGAPPYMPKVGDVVRIGGSGTKGEVVSVEEGGGPVDVEVLMGGMKLSVKSSKLTPVEGVEAGGGKGSSTHDSHDGGTVTYGRGEGSRKVKVIGMRAEEALRVVQDFLDQSIVEGYESVEVIHGKGAGILAKVLHESFKENSTIKDFYFGHPDSGGTGVTIVVFK